MRVPGFTAESSLVHAQGGIVDPVICAHECQWECEQQCARYHDPRDCIRDCYGPCMRICEFPPSPPDCTVVHSCDDKMNKTCRKVCTYEDGHETTSAPYDCGFC